MSYDKCPLIRDTYRAFLSIKESGAEVFIHQLEKTEWGYIRELNHPIGSRIIACVCVMTDKVVHVLSHLVMTIELIVKALFALIRGLNNDSLDGLNLAFYGVFLAFNAVITPLLSAGYIVCLSVAVPYGIACSLWDPAAYANRQINGYVSLDSTTL